MFFSKGAGSLAAALVIAMGSTVSPYASGATVDMESPCSGSECLPYTDSVAGSLSDTIVPSIYGTSLEYGMDTSVSPCDNLYQFANGGWRKAAVLPHRKGSRGMRMVTYFDHVVRSMKNELSHALESARETYSTTPSPTLRVLGTFYESCMAADTLEPVLLRSRKRDSLARDSTRSEQCLNRVQVHIAEVAGQYFAEQLIESGAVARMERLVAALKSEVIAILKEHPMMDHEEKAYAVERLEKLVLRVGIPEKLIDYSELKLDPTDYFKNRQTLLTFFNSVWVDGIGGNDREKWKASLLMPNAMYMPGDHAIEIPTLMFSPPFFYAQGDDALNFAAIGYVIGHEIFHSVTTHLHMLNDPAMRGEIESFKEFNTSMGSLDSWVADGRRTFNEDVADLGGGRVAYRAWKRLEEKRASSESINAGDDDSITPDQRFFIAMARVWRSKWDGGAPNNDVHAPHFARVNATAMQIPAFSQAFGCKVGDKMYLHPDQLSRIW